MKQIIAIASVLWSSISFSQEIKTTEETVAFTNGSHNAIVVTIPYGNKEIVESELKSEMKDWGGKYNSSKGEYTAMQASMKAMGEKMFDGYAKIIEGGDAIKVAFAVDLGGAFMDSRQHALQFKVIQERAKKFAAKAATGSVDEELAKEAKILKTMESDKKDLEKSIESSKSAIEDYKKKIADAEQKIKDNESALSTKGEEIATQTSKIQEVEKKKKAIK